MLGFGQCHNLSAKPMVVSYGFVSREADEEPVLHSGINHSKLKWLKSSETVFWSILLRSFFTDD